jgi:hypothetical protein
MAAKKTAAKRNTDNNNPQGEERSLGIYSRKGVMNRRRPKNALEFSCE